MTTRLISRFAIAIVAVSAVVRSEGTQTAGHEGVELFLQSVDKYMRLVHDLERQWPPLEPGDDAQQVRDVLRLRADGIRRARADARAGDLFNPSVSTLFRARIGGAFSVPRCDREAIVREMSELGEAWERPVVNGRFRWRTAASTPPCVLAVLPPLPGPLQFRFVGTDLVLLDITANLIVDILPGVMDTGAVTDTRPAATTGRD